MDKVLNAETFNYEAMAKYKNLNTTNSSTTNKNEKISTNIVSNNTQQQQQQQQLNKVKNNFEINNKKLTKSSNYLKLNDFQPSDKFSIYDPNNTARMRQTLDVLVSQLHRTESEIDRQRLKIALKKKTKHYMHDK